MTFEHAEQQPHGGEVAYANVFARLESLGYPGYIGCEYAPASGGHRSYRSKLGRAHPDLTPPIIDTVVASADDLLVAQGAERLAARRDAAVARILEAALDRPSSPVDRET
jgi:hypothetical protein